MVDAYFSKQHCSIVHDPEIILPFGANFCINL
jgi:hypothetical protein